MTVAQAEILCTKLLHQLDELEACLVSLPAAQQFCFEAQRDVKELRMCTRLETVHNLTNEQAQHLLKLQNQVNSWLKRAHQ